jgi:hypothetical protein
MKIVFCKGRRFACREKKKKKIIFPDLPVLKIFSENLHIGHCFRSEFMSLIIVIRQLFPLYSFLHDHHRTCGFLSGIYITLFKYLIVTTISRNCAERFCIRDEKIHRDAIISEHNLRFHTGRSEQSSLITSGTRFCSVIPFRWPLLTGYRIHASPICRNKDNNK